MIDCTEYRRSMLADPRDPDPRLAEHRAACHDCNLYTERLLNFESRLERALHVAVPPERALPLRAAAPRPVPRAQAYRRGRLAMAASVLLALVVAGALWLAAPGPSLAADVAAHMQGEPGAWRTTDPVPSSELQDVLRDSRLQLTAGAGVVSYASSCAFRGHHVPHLVVQTGSGPVTVMVLVHESVAKPVQFDEQGYRGSHRAGGRPWQFGGAHARPDGGYQERFERTAARVLDSIVWTG